MQKSKEFEIVDGVPIPNFSPSSKYPVADLAVGDSFLVPEDELTYSRQNAVRVSVWRIAKRLGFKTATRQVPEGIRVWRIS